MAGESGRRVDPSFVGELREDLCVPSSASLKLELDAVKLCFWRMRAVVSSELLLSWFTFIEGLSGRSEAFLLTLDPLVALLKSGPTVVEGGLGGASDASLEPLRAEAAGFSLEPTSVCCGVRGVELTLSRLRTASRLCAFEKDGYGMFPRGAAPETLVGLPSMSGRTMLTFLGLLGRLEELDEERAGRGLERPLLLSLGSRDDVEETLLRAEREERGGSRSSRSSLARVERGESGTSRS